LKKFSGTKLYILEQYLLQNIWSALMSAQIKRVKPPVLSPVIQILYSDLNAVILFFEISPADAARRVSTRLGGESRFDGLPIKEIENNLNSYSRLMEDIINAARQAGLIVIKAESCSLQNFS